MGHFQFPESVAASIDFHANGEHTQSPDLHRCPSSALLGRGGRRITRCVFHAVSTARSAEKIY